MACNETTAMEQRIEFIADLLGTDLPSSPKGVTLDWIKQHDIKSVRAVAEAFLEGIPGLSGGV